MAGKKTNEVAQITQTNTPTPVVRPTPRQPVVVTNTPPAQATTNELFYIPRPESASTLQLASDRKTRRTSVGVDVRLPVICRKLHGFVREVVPNHKDNLACVLVPMPLDAACNKQLKSTAPSHNQRL